MTFRVTVPALVTIGVLATAVAGCGSDGGGSPPPTGVSAAGENLPPLAMPDVSGLSDMVREQLLEEHRSFSQTIASSTSSDAERAAAYGRLGELLLAATFSDAAETCYRHAEALVPGDVRWTYSLGHVYLVKGDRSKAAASFERALALRPADLPSLVWLGETLLDDGRPEAAEPIFRKAMAAAPGSAAAAFGTGRAALARRAYPEAVTELERALAIEARASAVHYPLAMAHRGMGNREKAEAHLRLRGTTWPSMPDPLRPATGDVLKSAAVQEAEGISALRSGDWAAAVAAFRRGLELNPGDPALRHRLGTALYAGGDVAGAVREFEEVARRSPEFVKAQVSLGVILNLNGRYQEAVGRFTKAIAVDPAFPEGHLGLAEAQRMSGGLDVSLQHYERAIALDPGLVEAWIGGAQALLGLGRRQAAAEWLSEARRVHPDRPELAQLAARLQ